MELTDDVVRVMTPCEMRMLRKKLAATTLDVLSRKARISKSQLSQFENGPERLAARPGSGVQGRASRHCEGAQ